MRQPSVRPEAVPEVRRGICGLCGGSCLVDVHCDGQGVITKVEGDREPPYSSGALCVKGAALRQATYHPDRLLYPMKRVGSRGKGEFCRITWDEALDILAQQLLRSREQYGGKSTMLYVGHPKWFRTYLTDFANRYGTPNLGTESSSCAYALMMASQCCFGRGVMMPPPDLARCRTLLIWGVNPLYSSSPDQARRYLDAVDRGVKVIAVDPRCTPTTERAEIHLRPIPGTDGALALGMAYVMITEQLYDRAYVEQYTTGFEEYRDYVMNFPPQRVEEITGVPAHQLIQAARLFAGERPAAVQMSASPLVHNINGVQNSRAILLLSVLTGSFGRPGGICPPGPGRPALKWDFLGTRLPRPEAEADLSHTQFPAWARLIPQEAQVIRMADYLEGKGDYPIHTLLSFGMNHHMWPRPDRLERSFGELDFFSNADIYRTPTCAYADLLLPVCSSLEREQILVQGPGLIRDVPAPIEPLGEARTDLDILLELARRMGFSLGDGEVESYEDYLQALPLPTGLTLEELRAHPEGMMARKMPSARTEEDILRVNTPSGKIEFVSGVLADCDAPGHDGLPVYRDFRQTLPMEDYPLILSTGCRKPQLFHSRTWRLPWLQGLEPAPVVDIHPEDAARLGLAQGQRAILTTPVGSLELPVNLDTSCLPGVVNVYHGAGELDVNLLVDDRYLDPISGFPGYKAYCCRLEAKGGGQE